MAAGTWNSVRGLRAVVPDHVVHRAMAQETVLLNVNTGTYHGIDEIGSRFFELLRTGRAIQEFAPGLASEYGQPLDVVQADLAAFCAQLADAGLIELTPRCVGRRSADARW